MSTAGVITYKINADFSLDGRWTHPDVATGTEKASGVVEGPGGVREVQIYGPDGAQIAAGSLTIAAEGDGYSLTWSVSEGGKQSVFTGVGLIDASRSLAACFQERDYPRTAGAVGACRLHRGVGKTDQGRQGARRALSDYPGYLSCAVALALPTDGDRVKMKPTHPRREARTTNGCGYDCDSGGRAGGERCAVMMATIRMMLRRGSGLQSRSG
jgi:hypothetical protein